MLIEKIVYTLCIECKSLFDDLYNTIHKEQKIEIEKVNDWLMKKNKEALRKRKHLDEDKYNRLRALINEV